MVYGRHISLSARPLVDGDGVLAAGVVAAGAAVQLVLGRELAHARPGCSSSSSADGVGDALVVGGEGTRGEVEVGETSAIAACQAAPIELAMRWRT